MIIKVTLHKIFMAAENLIDERLTTEHIVLLAEREVSTMQEMAIKQPPTATVVNDNGHNGRQNGYRQEDYDLAAQLSHQILSCVTKLKIVTHVLENMDGRVEPTPPLVIKTLTTVVRELNSMGRTVRQLETPAHFDSGPTSQVVDLVPLIEEVVQPFLIQAEGQMINREYQSHPLKVRGDAEKIQVVLDNLLSNALKYSTAGRPIIVQAELYPPLTEAERKKALVSVTNFGSFIPIEERQKIFTKTYRREAHAQPGQGLGLYISRRLVEMQGGQLDVDSQLHDGTTFWFTLPLVEET